MQDEYLTRCVVDPVSRKFFLYSNEGESHEDYPGGNEGYSFNFEHNYVKNLIQETVREHLDKGS